MAFTQLETDILKWYADKAEDKNLIKQLNTVKPKEREISEVGSFVDLKLPPSTKGEKCQVKNPINGPKIKSPHLKDGGSSLLFISNGLISVLEIFSDGDATFPKELIDYELLDIKENV